MVRGLQRCGEGKEVRPSVATKNSLDLESLAVPVTVTRDRQDSELSGGKVAPQPAAGPIPPPIVLPQTSSAVEPLPPPSNQSP